MHSPHNLPDRFGKLLALVLPLGLDTFAIAAALGLTGLSASRRRQITLLFTAFEAGMPLIGLAAGAPLGNAIGGAAEYVAVGVLIAFGLYTLLRSQDEERIAELAGAATLRSVALGASVSLDEFAIGFTLGLLRLPVVLVIVLIAVQTILVTQLGLRLSEQLREAADRIAGLALAGLGLSLLLEKLLS